MEKLKIAVIGSGISGLSCAWLLSKRHNVDLFEKNSYFGGHANTQEISLNSSKINVDTGFIVFNSLNYPNLCNLFDILNVDTYESDMSFSVSNSIENLEYGGENFNTIFAQKSNIFKPRFLKMLLEILIFYNTAEKERKKNQNKSLEEYLKKKKFSDFFLYNHIYPMASSIWSSSIDNIKNYPYEKFVDFFSNHGLLKILNRPRWRTVMGGSKDYVKKIIKSSTMKTKNKCNIEVMKRASKSILVKVNGKSLIYDHVVVAVHSNQVSSVIKDQDTFEKEIFSKIEYSKNLVYLHSDNELMPKSKKVWSSWNYIRNDLVENKISITYWMNRLQNLKTKEDIFVSLNPNVMPKKKKIYKRINYSHPIYNFETFDTQAKIQRIQGKKNTWYCGAYLGNGFHEDGIESGLSVAEKILGEKRPWTK